MATLNENLRKQRQLSATSEIAKVAIELFIEKGYEATNVDEIAAAAGCSPRTLYRYFGSKEAVLFHDLEVRLERFKEVLDAQLADQEGLWAAVSESLVTLISQFDEDEERFASSRMSLWLNEPSARGRFVSYITAVEDLVTESIEEHRGSKKSDDLPRLIAVAATSAYRAVVVNHHASRSGQSLASHLRSALAVIGDGGLGRA